MDLDGEQHRHECECRYWLKDTSGKPAKVVEVIDRITRKRGKAAAARLHKGMREEFRRQKEARR